MMTDEMTCRICGGDLASNRHPALKMHQSLSTCIKTLRARAEAAEAELANYKQWHEQEQIRAVDAEYQWGELVGELIPALGLPDEEHSDNAGEMILAAVAALQSRAEAAENRLAELEAAARWRPVSEKPVDDKPVLSLLESGEYKVVRYVTIGDVNGVPLHHWRGTGGTSKHVAYWRPITEEAPAE